jgi:Protein of unknown function (DUF1569)
MKNLFNPDTYCELTFRIQNLQPESKAKSGNMNAPQMLAQASQACKVPLSEEPMPRTIMGRLFGWALKPDLSSDKPFKQNFLTSSTNESIEPKDFNNELLGLLTLVETFHTTSTEKIGRYAHPVFGKLTPEQWGQVMYKNLDQHLVEFGV